jgi:hypothetical protein
MFPSIQTSFIVCVFFTAILNAFFSSISYALLSTFIMHCKLDGLKEENKMNFRTYKNENWQKKSQDKAERRRRRKV